MALAAAPVAVGPIASAGASTGAITEFPVPTNGSEPFGIAAGPGGNLWFVEVFGTVGRITTSGAVTEFPVPTSGTEPRCGQRARPGPTRRT